MFSLVSSLAALIGACILIAGGSVNLIAVGQATLLAGFAATTVVGNGARLHLSPLGWAPRVAVACIGAAIFAISYWSLTAAIASSTGPVGLGVALAQWGGATILGCSLVVAVSAAVYAAGSRPYATHYPPLMGVIQDAFHLSALWLILGWLPQIAVANVRGGTPERWAAVGTIIAGFLLLFGPAFLWVLENNDTHTGRERIRRGAPLPIPGFALANAPTAVRVKSLVSRIRAYMRRPSSSEGRADSLARMLEGHTALQNALALTLAALTLVGIVGIASGATQTPPTASR
jgi:hypothetical protein